MIASRIYIISLSISLAIFFKQQFKLQQISRLLVIKYNLHKTSRLLLIRIGSRISRLLLKKCDLNIHAQHLLIIKQMATARMWSQHYFPPFEERILKFQIIKFALLWHMNSHNNLFGEIFKILHKIVELEVSTILLLVLNFLAVLMGCFK